MHTLKTGQSRLQAQSGTYDGCMDHVNKSKAVKVEQCL